MSQGPDRRKVRHVDGILKYPKKQQMFGKEMKISLRKPFVCWFWLAAASGGLLSAATLNGRVLGEDGKPVVGAVVAAMRSGALGQPPKAQVNGRGEFSFTGLEPGGYRFCIDVAGSRFVDPCLWAPPIALFNLKSASDVLVVNLTAEAGSELQVRLTDTQGQLERALPNKRLPQVTVGVLTPMGLFIPAAVAGKGTNYRDYKITIPFEVPARVSVNSLQLQLRDEQKKTLPELAPPVEVIHRRKGPAPTAIALEVVGVRP
jgi:hypothetical protein